AAMGDTLSKILEECGYEVVREFYINDAGRQIRLLGESIYSRWRQSGDPGYPFPQEGYHGQYVFELAEKISSDMDLGSLPEDEAVEICSKRGKEIMLQEIRDDLKGFGVEFDVWFSELELYESGLLQETLSLLKSRGYLYEKDGALWIKTTEFGDDKDRVVKKQDGEFTYFASDISYHLNKKKRGFDKAINIWGGDHHGYVSRVKAALKAQGIDDNWLHVLLIQLVKLWRGGEEIKMSKRAGQYVTLRELIEEVGKDAVRFLFLTKNHDSPLDFDIDMAKKRDPNNPVYYVQYAHARICSIFRRAQEQNLGLPPHPQEVLGALELPQELDLIRIIAQYPDLLEEISKSLEPHRLTYYLTELASAFHKYFNLGTKDPTCRVVSQDQTLTQARLLLAQGVRVVLANGLRLLGVSAPERM
ncbi:MAG TPA: arginine--tRNA ligase, partial [Desulfobacterales bacterium]|nr:arginine--tRNA ligase [Desulfobacterales bacterium]